MANGANAWSRAVPANSNSGPLSDRALPLFTLALLLAAWVWVFRQARPEELFGQQHDDTLLMSSAKALAEGKGYVLPSLPDPRGSISPVATKYPVLFPLLLSLAWRWNPHFPGNLTAALDVVMIFGCLALLACFAFVRSLGVGCWGAVGITAYCGFHFIFLMYGLRIMTDIPTMALLLFACVVADRALAPMPPWWMMPAAGLLAAAATLMRTVGVTIILAVVALALLRRRFPDAGIFLAACVPLLAIATWWPGNNSALHAWASQGGPGFRQTWAFYTSYTDFWKLSTPNLQVFSAMVTGNLLMALVCPAFYFLLGPLGPWAPTLLHIILSVVIVVGVAAHARHRGLRTIHLILILQCGVFVAWAQYGDFTQRFFLPFLPLFCVGLWWELRGVGESVLRTMRSSRPMLEKALAAAMALGLIAAATRSAGSYVVQTRLLVRKASRQQALLEPERGELYSWVRNRTDPATRLVS